MALVGTSALSGSVSYGTATPPPPPAPSTGTPQPFTLTSPQTGVLPFAVGYAMAQGHVPSGSSLSFTGPTAKMTVLSTWPDGSARHGIIAGTYTSAGSAVTVTPTVATVTAGTALTGAAVQTAMGSNTAAFDAGAFGSATFSGADFATPFVTHAATDTFIEAIYRKQIGSDAHLVAWLSLRVWASGQVEALPWIENGYLTVAGPTNKSATYTFTLGGTSRFSAAIDLKHHTRTPLVSGSLLSHWLGTDPGVTPLHDAAYLQTTELVPTYAGVVPASASVITALPSTYTPLQAGSLSYSADDMSSTGYQAPIGLLPEHDVLHLVAESSARAATYAAVVRNGYSAGRYGIHYRDETTNRPAAFSTYPTLVLAGGGIKDVGASTTSTYTPTRTGGDPPLWDTAHCPSVGYMAYLLTGRFYFMEEVQFAATAIHFSVTDWARGGGVSGGTPAPGYTGASGIVSGFVQLRAGAWWMRSLAQALCVTQATDSLYAEFKASVQNTVNFHHAKYVAQSNNPFGFVQPDVDYGTVGIYRSSPWMQDFYTAAFGYAKAMGLPLDTTPAANLTAFFAWTAQSVVGRLGTSSSPDWWHINAAPYTIAVAPTDTPDWATGTGPWYASWRAMYDATAATETGRGSTEGILAGSGEAFPEPTSPSTWHNLQPALAYAVRHGVSGAQAAYDRMVSASNWSTIQGAWADKPVWSVMPRLPSWRRDMALNQAVSLSGTTIRYGQGPGTRLSYSGLAGRDALLVLAAAGGHNDCSDNGVDSLDLWADAPAWTARIAPSASPATLVNHYPDGKPSSRHTYNHTIYSPQRGRLVLHGTRSPWGASGGLTPNASNGLDLGAWAWDAAGTVADSGACIVQDSAGRAYSLVPYFAMAEYDPVANTKTTLAGFANEVTYPMAHDSKRDQFFQCSWGDGQGGGTGRRLYKYSSRFATQTAITLNASAAATALNADTAVDCTMFYVAALDAYFYWTGVTLYKITPNSGTAWDVSIVSITGSSLPSPSHAHTRAYYVPSMRCMAYLPSDTGLLYMVRVA